MALGEALTLAAERIVEPVELMHRRIARRWFDRFAPLSRPIRISHDAVSAIVYQSIGFGSVLAGRAIDALVDPGSQKSHALEAVVNGLWGDRRRSRSTTMRLSGGSVGELDALGAPTPTSHLVVLVHGLMQTETVWRGTWDKPGLMQRLEAHPELTPLAVRYNTGLPVHVNGARLSAMLDDVCATWPTPVESIALVGHSMGGMVALAACKAAGSSGHRWVDHLTDLVTIGAPHRGAPLEKLVAVAARALAAVPTTEPIAGFLDSRSHGIRDLRWGPDDRTSVPAHVRQHFVAGVVTADPLHPIGALVGDLMVRPSSTNLPHVVPANAVVFGGVHHFGLVQDDAVIDRLMQWLGEPSQNHS